MGPQQHWQGAWLTVPQQRGSGRLGSPLAKSFVVTLDKDHSFLPKSTRVSNGHQVGGSDLLRLNPIVCPSYPRPRCREGLWWGISGGGGSPGPHVSTHLLQRGRPGSPSPPPQEGPLSWRPIPHWSCTGRRPPPPTISHSEGYKPLTCISHLLSSRSPGPRGRKPQGPPPGLEPQTSPRV